ncbi:hypothetical protein EDD18DRAFT_1102045 [Armillaria luteobubalina]|uniref:Uncharacterized protein n=1 Tax=Armillaria luteobubalina TaxID=153913 RepID=A0AA39QFH9_9AGAR|nr:hypothetical protein EDD18DRAFT_1102045 [Armillaria luteobubalina]
MTTAADYRICLGTTKCLPRYLPSSDGGLQLASLYELLPFPSEGRTDSRDSVGLFPDHVLDLDQNSFWPVGKYQTDFIHTPDPVPTYDAFLPLFLPNTTPVDAERFMQRGTPITISIPDIVDLATEPLPCKCPVSSARPSPLTLLPEMDEDTYAKEPVYEESEFI